MSKESFLERSDRTNRDPAAHRVSSLGQDGAQAPRTCSHFTLFELAPDGYLTTDRDGRIQEANRLAATLLRTPRVELSGASLASFVSREQRSRFAARLAGLRGSDSRGVEEWEVRLQPPGADPMDAALTVAAIRESEWPEPRLLWGVRDITRRKRMERRLKEGERRYRLLYRRMLSHRNQLRVLSARYLGAKEEEAKQIAHQLHDEAGQITASAHLALAEVARRLPPRARERLQEVRAFLDDVEERLRRVSHEIRPTILDDLGLAPALEFLAQGFSARAHMTITVEGSTEGRLEPLVETAIYRIVQEALNNVTRHSAARRAWIRLAHRPEVLRCSIRDDGVGFEADRLSRGEPAQRGLGLLGMRERLDALGGRMRVRSKPGKGTDILVSVPLGSRS